MGPTRETSSGWQFNNFAPAGARVGNPVQDEVLLVAQRAAVGAIAHGLRHAARQRADAGVAEEDFIFRDGKFVLAQFLVRQDFGQSHAEKLAEIKKRQSGKIRVAVLRV